MDLIQQRDVIAAGLDSLAQKSVSVAVLSGSYTEVITIVSPDSTLHCRQPVKHIEPCLQEENRLVRDMGYAEK